MLCGRQVKCLHMTQTLTWLMSMSKIADDLAGVYRLDVTMRATCHSVICALAAAVLLVKVAVMLHATL